MLERLSALVDRLLYDLALIMSGRRAELEAYVDREIADRIRTTLQLFLDSGDVVRPDFGPYAEVRIEGDLLRGADPVSVWVDFENRSTREDPDGRLRALPRHRVRVRFQVVPALQRVSDFSLQLGRVPL